MAEIVVALRDNATTIGAGAAEWVVQRYTKQTRPVAVRPLATLTAAEDATTEVRWRHGLAATVELRGGTVVLQLPDRTITFPELCADAVQALHRGAVLNCASLPGLDPADGAVLIRRLLTEAVVVPVRRR
jgi:hypothetical protein